MARASFIPSLVKIKVFGVGGGGGNALTRMVREEIQGAEFIAVNTDAQALMINEASTRVQIGETLTRGLGVGGDNKIGFEAAQESREILEQMVVGADMVFIAAGMGGGTGTGASPIIAELAKQSGALTIAIVTKPFSFEGVHRAQVAEEGIAQLSESVDAIIVISNDRLFDLPDYDYEVTVDNAFKEVDEILMTGVRAITEVVTLPGLINLDFADIKAIMKDAGSAWLSIGHGSGRNRAVESAKVALRSPLLETDITGAKRILFTITGTSALTLAEVNQAASVIKNEVDPQANVIFGVTLDPRMDNKVRLVLIATGFTTAKATASAQRDDEFRRLLRSLDETELDLPAFLRRPLSSRRQVGKKP
jgi:cell division protein FtsZ